MSGELLVLAEHRHGALREITFELLALAQSLAADDAAEVTALLLGDDVASLAAELVPVADRVLTVEEPALREYDAERYLAVARAVLSARAPRLVLLGHTASGMDLAPALGARLALPLSTDCLAVALRNEGVAVVRQLYGGKIRADLELAAAPTALLTIRPGACPATLDRGRSGAIEQLPAPAWGRLRRRRWLGFEPGALEDVDISAAEVLVSVGRGVGKPENMAAVEAFASALGATLSCSRPVADKGWLPKSRQVGTSGKTVRPRIYIALGISGAYQHVAGMRNAGTIIAVNRDPAAPIFDVAHYGVVADLFEVLEPLAQRLKRG